jgi:hypothetical protein
MLDYQLIVDDIRSSLDSHEMDGMDVLRAAAADYSVACDEVNERLRQCGTLLRKGLRSEAIQLCEIDPNLLEVVAVLDFPERAQWMATSERYGLAPSPPLLLDVAGDLNEAYALEQPLAKLLQSHRLLALAHGPLSNRIQVLRQLAELDADNPVWEEDLRTFEIERLKQIPVEVRAAARAQDTAALSALDEEVSSPDWRNPPAAPLVQLVREASLRVHHGAVEKQLEELAAQLNEAMIGSDVQGGQALRQRWTEIITTSGFEPTEEITCRAAPALNWLSECDDAQRHDEEHQKAITTLARAILQERSPEKLQELHRHAAWSGEVPTNLEDRYRSWLSAIKRAVRVRRCLQIGGIVGGAGLMLVIITVFILYMHREHAIDRVVEDVPSMIEKGEFEQAETLVRDLPKDVEKDRRVQDVIVLLRNAVEKESLRKAQLSEQLGTVKTWLEQTR